MAAMPPNYCLTVTTSGVVGDVIQCLFRARTACCHAFSLEELARVQETDTITPFPKWPFAISKGRTIALYGEPLNECPLRGARDCAPTRRPFILGWNEIASKTGSRRRPEALCARADGS